MKRKMSEWNKHREMKIPYFLLLLFCAVVIISASFFDYQFSTLEKSASESITNTTVYDVWIDAIDYELAIDYIKNSEKFEEKPYKLGEYRYIGYGHLIKYGENYKSITEIEASELLKKDLMHVIKYAAEQYNLRGSKALAVGMLFYNVKHQSIYSSALHAELLKNPNNWDIEKMKNSWLSLCKYGEKEHQGLKTRRKFEMNLFFGYDKK